MNYAIRRRLSNLLDLEAMRVHRENQQFEQPQVVVIRHEEDIQIQPIFNDLTYGPTKNRGKGKKRRY